MVNALIKDHSIYRSRSENSSGLPEPAAAYQSSAKGESLSRLDMARGLGLANSHMERAVGRADTIRIVGALWMIRFKA